MLLVSYPGDVWSCHLQLALQLAMQGSVSVWVGHVLVALPVFARCIQSQLVAPAINGISSVFRDLLSGTVAVNWDALALVFAVSKAARSVFIIYR